MFSILQEFLAIYDRVMTKDEFIERKRVSRGLAKTQMIFFYYGRDYKKSEGVLVYYSYDS